jgi:hypothetical protein
MMKPVTKKPKADNVDLDVVIEPKTPTLRNSQKQRKFRAKSEDVLRYAHKLIKRKQRESLLNLTQ